MDSQEAAIRDHEYRYQFNQNHNKPTNYTWTEAELDAILSARRGRQRPSAHWGRTKGTGRPWFYKTLTNTQ